MQLMRPYRILCLILIVYLSACQQERAPQYFTGHGTVKNIAAEQKIVRIEHEEIPGFMKAMTMDFAVKDSALLADIHAGDDITFTVEQTADSLYIIAIERENADQENAAPQAAQQPEAQPTTHQETKEAEQDDTRAEFEPFPAPDFHLTDQDGQLSRKSSIGTL